MDYLNNFAVILFFIVGAIALPGIGLLVSSFIRPKKPNPEKLSSYESGEEAVGKAHVNFNMRFYIIAIAFVLFDVEIVFLFPWATVFADEDLIKSTNGLWGWAVFAEMAFFTLVLLLGLVYLWKKGFLNWIEKKSKPIKGGTSPIPEEVYERFFKR